MEQMAEHEKPKDGHKSKEGEPEPEYEQNRKPSKLCRCNKTGIMSATSRINQRNCKCKELRKEPPKILCWNAHGLISSENKWKIDALKEQVSENNTLLKNFTSDDKGCQLNYSPICHHYKYLHFLFVS